MTPLVELFFPSLCIHCNEPTRHKFLCSNCWLLSKLLEPSYRCIHCFEEIYEPTGLCTQCTYKPLLPFPRAALFEKDAPIAKLLFQEESVKPIAAYAYYQHQRLDWDEPDLIAPILSNKTKIAKELGDLMNIPIRSLFRRVLWPLFPEKWEVKEHLYEENMKILFLDVGSTPRELNLASRAISEAFPKKIYVLSLVL